MRLEFRGLYAPIVTPFRREAVDVDAFRRNVQRYGETRLSGLVVLGSNGEAPLVDEDESEQLVRVARQAVAAHQVVIAGTGRESTRATIAATERAAAAGAHAVLVRTPAFFKPRMDADAFVRHYDAVAERSPVPVLLYNVTMFTGVSLPPDAVGRLAGHERIAGLKDSGSDLALLAAFIEAARGRLAVLNGSAPTLYPSLCIGAAGAVLAVAGVVPDICVRLFELVERGDHDAARALQGRLTPLARAVGARFGVPGLKAALDVVGYEGGDPRGPLAPVSPDVRATIEAELHAVLTPAPHG